MKTVWAAVTSVSAPAAAECMTTVSAGPPFTLWISRISATPRSSSARASMKTSSIALTETSRPGLLKEMDGPWSLSTSIR